MKDDLVEMLRTREGREKVWETVKDTDDILKMFVFKAVIGVLEEKDTEIERLTVENKRLVTPGVVGQL